MRCKKFLLSASVACASMAIVSPGEAAVIGTSGAAGNAAGLVGTVDFYRDQVGGPNNGNALGPIAGGRREINWDAGIVPFDMPGDFFNSPPTTRGAVLSTPGSGFAVSDPSDSDDPAFGDKEFNSFDAGNPIQFTTFSADRLFTAVGSTEVEVTFFVPGTDTQGTVDAFGAVFTDVDILGSTKLEYFNSADELIHTALVPVSSGGLSFAGVTSDEPIARVLITSGNANIDDGAEDIASGLDVVVMDDFIYSEPVPEPTSAIALALGGLGLMFRRRD